MKKIKIFFLGFIAVGLLGLPIIGHAQDLSQGQGDLAKWHSGQRIQEIYNQLHLTDEQKKQLEANKKEHRSMMEGARQQMKILKESLRQEIMSPVLDMPKIKQTHALIKALQNQMEDDKLNSILAVRIILTQEQFMEFVNLMHKHRK